VKGGLARYCWGINSIRQKPGKRKEKGRDGQGDGGILTFWGGRLNSSSEGKKTRGKKRGERLEKKERAIPEALEKETTYSGITRHQRGVPRTRVYSTQIDGTRLG